MLLQYELRKRSCTLSRRYIGLFFVRVILNIVLIEVALRQIFILLILLFLLCYSSPSSAHIASTMLYL